MDNREPELPILLYSVMGGDFQRQTPNPLDSLIWALPASEGRLGSKLMVTKVLPEGPVAPLEEAPLKGLIQRALRAGLRDLNGTDVSGDDWLVFRPTSEGYSSTRLPAPMYVRETVWNRIQEIWKSQESDELTEYLWSRGAFKKTLTRDDELPPSREAWERVVWGELVHGPLLVLLNRAASEELTLTGAYVPWNIDDAAIELAAADLARQSCRREFTFTAICPIIGLKPIRPCILGRIGSKSQFLVK